jgi:DNA-binding transcriptional LysR family regulator
MELQNIDLNLLIVFSELLKRRRVSAAAAALGISQPAISNALSRLRRLLGDELFLRTGHGMMPTPLAETLAEPVGYALGAIHDALNAKTVFDPASSQRTFTLAMTDIGETYFLPALMDLLARQAPSVRIVTVREQADVLRVSMEHGEIDLAIGFLPDLQSGFFQRRLFRQRYVCLLRQEHPLAHGQLTLKAFLAAEHVAIAAAGTGHSTVDTAIQRLGVRRNVHLRVPHFVAVGYILQTTDLIAVVPQAYARQTLTPFKLTSMPCPVKIPDVAINMLWHARNHRAPDNQWLRQLIFNAFARA